ncbi:MAG: TetR/AcrR family transcriptional regulator [Microbacteriaceae bacterium]
MTVVLEPRADLRAPWAKQRILDTADELFYNDGIRIVGVDRLINVSSVTKATFYKHYGSKERLILAYITGRHEAMQVRISEIIEASVDAEDALRNLVNSLSATISAPCFRGCAFANAASEFPDPAHPVRGVIAEHRDWKTGVLSQLLAELGHAMPGDAADEFMLAIDGAHAGGYAGDPVAATTAFQRLTGQIITNARA